MGFDPIDIRVTSVVKAFIVVSQTDPVSKGTENKFQDGVLQKRKQGGCSKLTLWVYVHSGDKPPHAVLLPTPSMWPREASD